MPTLNIGGKRVTVGDEFLALSPEDQQKTVNDIAAQIGVGAPAPVVAPPVNNDVPPAGAKPGSREYADWALQRSLAGKAVPMVSDHNYARPETSPVEQIAAFTASAADAVPIAGPKIREGLESLRASVQGMTPEQVKEETLRTTQENPTASMAGSITGTVAPFLAAASVPVAATILGFNTALPLLANVGIGAASQAAISTADALVRGGDAEDAKNAALLGGAGGAAGPLVGKAAEMIGTHVLGPTWRALKGATAPTATAEKAIANVARPDVMAGRGLTPADEAIAAANGQPLINADRLGPAAKDLARTAVNTDPAAKANLSEVVQDRFLTQNLRAEDWVKRNTGAPTNVQVVQQWIDRSAKGTNNAAYPAAYNQPAAKNIWTPEIEQLMQSDTFRSAIKAAVKTSNEEAALTGAKAIQNPFVFNQLNKTYSPRPGTEPSLQFWDHVQRALRRRASQVGRSGEFDFDAGQISRLRGQLNEVLDRTVPEFATARGGAAKWFGAEDALEAGQKFAAGKSDIAEATAAHAKFSPTDKRLFASGFASDLIGKINSVKDPVNVINTVFGSPHARSQIELAMGPAAAKELESFVRIEHIMNATKQAVQGGSNTAAQLASMGVLGGIGGGLTGSGGNINPLTWNPAHIASGAGLFAIGRLGARSMGVSADQKVMREIARLLASDDPQLIKRAVENASRSSKSATAVKAIEQGLAMVTRMAPAGAAAASVQPETIN